MLEAKVWILQLRREIILFVLGGVSCNRCRAIFVCFCPRLVPVLFVSTFLYVVNFYTKFFHPHFLSFVEGGGGVEAYKQNTKMLTTLPPPKHPDSSAQCPQGTPTFQIPHSLTKRSFIPTRCPTSDSAMFT